ncbi:MAG: IclR family transcriptional regulator [Terricaulis sp.]
MSMKAGQHRASAASLEAERPLNGARREIVKQAAVGKHESPTEDGAGTGARALVPALDRAMRILTMLEESPQRSYTVSDIARVLRIPKSTAFNICGALTQGQLLRRSRDGFQLGRRLVQLGSAYVSSVNLVSEFYDACRPVPLDIEATIQLAVLDENFDTVYLAYQDCNSGLRLGLASGIGRRIPANCTACGKALLAMLPPDELERRLDNVDQLVRLTRKSIVSRAKLQREIVETRKHGRAVDEEETIAGLSCVAAAFSTTHADGGFVAVSISAATTKMSEDRRAKLRSVLDQLVAVLRGRL